MEDVIAKAKLQDFDPNSLLIRLVDMFSQLTDKLNQIIEFNEKILKINEGLLQGAVSESSRKGNLRIEPDPMALLSLPLALRKTAIVLYRLEQATADDLAKETERLRAVESAAANELVRMGYIKKRRVGRDVYFYIESSRES